MRLHNALLRGFYMAPSGKAADATETADDEGEITDDEVLGAGDGEGDEAPVDEGTPDGDAVSEVDAGPVSYKDYFAKAGLNDVPDDPAQFASRYQQMAAAQTEAANQRQMIGMLQWQLAQAAQPKQEAPKPQERKKLWEIPQFDPALKQGLMLDENGTVVVKPGYDPRLPQQYQEYQTKREAAMDQALQLLSDPQAFYEQHLQQTIAPFVQEQAQQIAQMQFVQMQEQQALRQFEHANREWIFQADGQTLTPLANAWNQHYQQAKQFGHPNAIAYAESQIKAMERDYLIAQQQNPAQTEAEKKMALLNSARRTPNRGGSFPNRNKKSPPQNGKADLWAETRRKLKELPDEDLDDM